MGEWKCQSEGKCDKDVHRSLVNMVKTTFQFVRFRKISILRDVGPHKLKHPTPHPSSHVDP